jgi:hypothetical protein
VTFCWASIGSPTICQTRMRGSSDPTGSWNTICTLRRQLRSSLPESSVTSTPSNRIRPLVAVRRRLTIHPNVVFPEPDSPINPRVSPGAIESDTPSTAWTARGSARRK